MDNGENIHVISEQEDRALAAMARSVPDIIYRLDEQGYIVYISAAVRHYGYEPDELIGRNIFDLVHPDDREKATYKVNERRRGERGTRLLEVRLMTKDHEAVDFELSADAWPTFLDFELVVDDEEVVRESTRKLLEHSGFRVLVAEGGEAVELARREAVDLVLLDLSMPDISGPEVLAALRRDGIAARVVFFTGYLAAADQYAGVDGVLQKPFTADELMDLVHQMLDD